MIGTHRVSFYVESLDTSICYWSHFNVTNTDSINQLRTFHFANVWKEIECYFPNEDGKIELKTVGDFNDQKILFLNFPPAKKQPVYIKYIKSSKSTHPFFLNVKDIYDKDFYALQNRTYYKFLILGALFFPFLFFLIQFSTQRDLLTLYYLVFLIGSSMYLISILDQISFFSFSPKILKTAFLISRFYAIGSLLSLFGLVKFIHLFLDIQGTSNRIYKIGNIILWIFLFSVLTLLLPFHLLKNGNKLAIIFSHIWRFGGVVTFGYALFLNIYGFVKKIKFSGSLLVAFSPLLITGIFYALAFLLFGFQILSSLYSTELLLPLGFILTILLFGVVLGVRNNAVKAEKIQMQEEMLTLQEKVNQQLVKVDLLKDQFLANTSHELRTPLQGIIGLSESLHERETQISKRQELGMIISSGKRLSSLVNSILDFSKLKTHELKLSIKAVDLRTITEVVIQISQPLLKGKSIKIIDEISPSVSLVEADEERVYQIMHNLIGNSIKFTNEGSIQIYALEKQNVVQVFVKDTGIGIPEDKIGDIFNSFEQVDASDSREYGGTGLGLTITKQLVELHGGNIGIESKIDQGTSVYFTLPKSSKHISIVKEHQELSKVTDTAGVTNGIVKQENEEEFTPKDSRYNILIVDDEPINQRVLSNHLEKSKFRILQAMNGQEALNVIEQKRLDLVLLDIMMPKMSGYEVCKEIRKKFLPSELPVIMITAKDQVTDLVEGLASGANDYLAKPFSKDELLARLGTHLNLYNINKAYLRFIPKEFIRALGHDSIIDVKLGDQVQGEMTIVFSDIRSFTSLTEELSSEESFEFLNDFLNCITPAIISNDGFIDKYIGDAVMALFPKKPEDAVKAAIEAQKNLAEYNNLRKNESKSEIKIGIGIHTGPLMIGTIGVENRMDGTVISDAVNLASRLEELNKHYGTSLIISEETVKKLKDPEKYHHRFLSNVSVKGKQLSNKIYEFFDGDSDHDKKMKIKTLPAFKRGIEEYYNKRFAQASVEFQEILKMYPQDKTTRIFLEHSAKYMVEGVPVDWDGVDIVDKVF